MCRLSCSLHWAQRQIRSGEACNDEFAFHLFTDSGEEIALPYLDTFTGGNITDYQNTRPSKEYRLSFADSPQEYILLLAGNAAHRKIPDSSFSKEDWKKLLTLEPEGCEDMTVS